MQKADLLRLPGRRYNETYRKDFSEDELVQLRAEFVEKSKEAFKMEEEKKEFMDDWKENMKPIKTELDRLLPIASNGYEMVTKEVEYFVNDDLGIVEFVDPETGDIVGDRKLRNEEKLPLINQINEQDGRQN